MHRFARSTIGLVTGCLVMIVAAATPAGAQDVAAGGQPPPAPRQGPMVVQQISSGFVLTPEVRFTEVNHSWGTQLGASAGWLYDESIFIGGAFYGLVGGADDAQLMYGGFVTGWSTPISGAVRVGARALFGWGHSEMFEAWNEPGYCHRGTCYDPWVQQAWVYQNFFVFEPQATVTFQLGKQVALEVGGGYRLTGNNDYGGDSHVNGAFGSVGIRVGVF